jgi:CPA1 family monovalent cation:H+ antiporter
MDLALRVQTVELLLLVAAVVAMLARRLHVPYSVGLVVAGITLAISPFAPTVELTKDLIFTVLLPPLIFEAAFYLNWNKLRADLPVILVLATAGVLISAAATALGMNLLVGWPWAGALVFGVLIAATDPVSVIATFKEARVVGRLRLLVEAESLFNDGTSAVAFGIVIALAAGQNLTPFDIGTAILLRIGGSIVCGALLAGVVLLLGGRTNDQLVETTLTTVAAYGSYLLSEHFHWSGVLATLTSGLMLGSLGPRGALSEKCKDAVEAFWQYAAFVANSLIFLLIGMHEAHQNFVAIWRSAAIAIVIVILSRALAIYPLCLVFSRSGLRVSRVHQHVLFWGGLRGALALALALGLPEMPVREDIITITFAVVAFSLFVQGLTMLPFLRWTGELPSVRPNEAELDPPLTRPRR